MKIIDIITELNKELHFKGGFECTFYFKTDGFRYFIYSGNELLWDSDDDNRKLVSLNKYEDLELHLKKEFNKYVSELNRLKFEIE